MSDWVEVPVKLLSATPVQGNKIPKEKWTMLEHRYDHCPGGCYVFGVTEKNMSARPWAKIHIPADMFWGREPWKGTAAPVPYVWTT